MTYEYLAVDGDTGSIEFKGCGDELDYFVRGQDRMRADIRDIRADVEDLRGTVALRGDLFRILGLLVLTAVCTAFVVGLLVT